MKEIKLSNSSKIALVDDEDYEKVMGYDWRLNIGYPAIKVNCNYDKSKHKYIFMHQFLGFNNHDHKDRNRLNNQKDNLERATQQQNCMNRATACNNISGFKGVCLDGQRGLWKAYIKINRRQIFIGRFDRKEEAALAYNERAKELFGEFAYLNEVT